MSQGTGGGGIIQVLDMHVKLPRLEVLQLTHHMLNFLFLFHGCIFSGGVIYDNFTNRKDVVGRGATMGVKNNFKVA